MNLSGENMLLITLRKMHSSSQLLPMMAGGVIPRVKTSICNMPNLEQLKQEGG